MYRAHAPDELSVAEQAEITSLEDNGRSTADLNETLTEMSGAEERRDGGDVEKADTEGNQTVEAAECNEPIGGKARAGEGDGRGGAAGEQSESAESGAKQNASRAFSPMATDHPQEEPTASIDSCAKMLSDGATSDHPSSSPEPSPGVSHLEQATTTGPPSDERSRVDLQPPPPTPSEAVPSAGAPPASPPPAPTPATPITPAAGEQARKSRRLRLTFRAKPLRDTSVPESTFSSSPPLPPSESLEAASEAQPKVPPPPQSRSRPMEDGGSEAPAAAARAALPTGQAVHVPASLLPATTTETPDIAGPAVGDTSAAIASTTPASSASSGARPRTRRPAALPSFVNIMRRSTRMAAVVATKAVAASIAPPRRVPPAKECGSSNSKEKRIPDGAAKGGSVKKGESSHGKDGDAHVGRGSQAINAEHACASSRAAASDEGSSAGSSNEAADKEGDTGSGNGDEDGGTGSSNGSSNGSSSSNTDESQEEAPKAEQKRPFKATKRSSREADARETDRTARPAAVAAHAPRAPRTGRSPAQRKKAPPTPAPSSPSSALAKQAAPETAAANAAADVQHGKPSKGPVATTPDAHALGELDEPDGLRRYGLRRHPAATPFASPATANATASGRSPIDGRSHGHAKRAPVMRSTTKSNREPPVPASLPSDTATPATPATPAKAKKAKKRTRPAVSPEAAPSSAAMGTEQSQTAESSHTLPQQRRARPRLPRASPTPQKKDEVLHEPATDRLTGDQLQPLRKSSRRAAVAASCAVAAASAGISPEELAAAEVAEAVEELEAAKMASLPPGKEDITPPPGLPLATTLPERRPRRGSVNGGTTRDSDTNEEDSEATEDDELVAHRLSTVAVAPPPLPLLPPPLAPPPTLHALPRPPSATALPPSPAKAGATTRVVTATTEGFAPPAATLGQRGTQSPVHRPVAPVATATAREAESTLPVRPSHISGTPTATTVANVCTGASATTPHGTGLIILDDDYDDEVAESAELAAAGGTAEAGSHLWLAPPGWAQPTLAAVLAARDARGGRGRAQHKRGRGAGPRRRGMVERSFVAAGAAGGRLLLGAAAPVKPWSARCGVCGQAEVHGKVWQLCFRSSLPLPLFSMARSHFAHPSSIFKWLMCISSVLPGCGLACGLRPACATADARVPRHSCRRDPLRPTCPSVVSLRRHASARRGSPLALLLLHMPRGAPALRRLRARRRSAAALPTLLAHAMLAFVGWVVGLELRYSQVI